METEGDEIQHEYKKLRTQSHAVEESKTDLGGDK
jgi:hypothetical protein